MKKKRGFTLVELLAVIAVLAIILVIAVPKIMNVIEDAREGTLLATAKIIAREAEKKLEEYKIKGIEDTIKCEDIGYISSSEYQSCNIKFDDNGVAKVTIKGNGKYDGMSVCNATRYNGEVTDMCYTDSACFAYEEAGIKDFDIDETACKNYIADWGLAAEQQTTYCTGGTFTMYYDTLIDWLNNMWEIVDVLEDYDVISNVVYDGSGNVTSLNINESACKSYFSDYGMNEEGLNSFCTGGPEGYIFNLKYDINEGYESASNLEDLGIISNVVYAGLEITNYDIWCGGQDVSVPSKIDGMEVIGIGYSAFCDGCGGAVYNSDDNDYKTLLLSNNLYNPKVVPLSSRYVLKSISLPNTIEYIDELAFADNELTSIDLSKLTKLKEIGVSAFANNQLMSVKLPSSITAINDYAFSDNYTRMNVNFNELTSLEYIGYVAFANNEISGALNFSNLTKLQAIENYAFSDNKITSVTLPSSVEFIGERAFFNIDSNWDNLLTYVHLGNTTNVEIGCSAFGEPSEIETHNLPNSYAACPIPN